MTPSLEQNPSTQRHEILSQETRDTRLSYGENPESPVLESVRYRIVTDRHTDRQTDQITLANTR